MTLGVLVPLAIALALALASCGDDNDEALAARQQEVADRGVDVMPFDLDATTHQFVSTADGLVETVSADDPTDAAEIDLIRTHLQGEADRFAAGDYGDPETIHGEGMPGLAELTAGADDIDIVYEEVDDGARIVFTTEVPELVEALRRWGEAQTSDHAEHAE